MQTKRLLFTMAHSPRCPMILIIKREFHQAGRLLLTELVCLLSKLRSQVDMVVLPDSWVPAQQRFSI